MHQQFFLALLVGLGGAVGSVGRYGMSLLMQRLVLTWPAGTLTVNILGCFVIGIITTVAERGGVPPEVRLTLATGFCGGFTTMSSMMYETAGMLRSGGYGSAAVYIGGTLVLSMAAFVAGSVLIRLLVK